MGTLLAASFFAIVVGCRSDELEGRVFLSGIVTADGTAVGVAVDFIPTAGGFDADKVQLAIDVQGDELAIGAEHTASACLQLPSKRLNLLAFDGVLETTSRVRVQAFRIDSTSHKGSVGVAAGSSSADGKGGSSGAGGATAGGGGVSTAVTTGGAGGASTLLPSSACTGTLLDDAVWPTRGAHVFVSMGGSGGTAGTGGTNGGTGGSPIGGAPVGGAGGDGGSPIGGEGGSTPIGGAGGEGNAPIGGGSFGDEAGNGASGGI